jgi:DNA-binding GntR family transcriptional regulator
MLELDTRIAGDEASHTSLGEYAYQTVRHNILAGELRPETRLREVELAAVLQVSRVPVREALRRLAEEKLVVLRPHGRGAVVATPTVEKVLEYYQARAALEQLSVKLAVDNITAETIRRLDEIVDRGREAALNEDFQLSSELGSEFHKLIALTSGNEHLYELICGYDLRIGWAHATVARRGGTVRLDEHAAIAGALKSGDAELAAQLMAEHTDASATAFAASERAARVDAAI